MRAEDSHLITLGPSGTLFWNYSYWCPSKTMKYFWPTVSNLEKKNYLKLLRLMIKQECFQKFIFYEAFMNNSIYIGKGNFLFILLFRKIDSRSFLSMLVVSSNTSFRIWLSIWYFCSLPTEHVVFGWTKHLN